MNCSDLRENLCRVNICVCVFVYIYRFCFLMENHFCSLWVQSRVANAQLCYVFVAIDVTKVCGWVPCLFPCLNLLSSITNFRAEKIYDSISFNRHFMNGNSRPRDDKTWFRITAYQRHALSSQIRRNFCSLFLSLFLFSVFPYGFFELNFGSVYVCWRRSGNW